MAKSTQSDPGRPSGEVLSATIDLASLDTIARPHDGTAYVLLELRESLLSEVRLWIEDVQFEFAVVDPVYGTVEPMGGSVTGRGWPLPLVRAVLDRVGVGLLEAADPR
ncbi:hypothetical protein HWV07_16425 [Natronomonas salina]|uniref:hypothetical protein n=1 Tax=Natronomonas salina TaxID=1710540 RepID=UPI0015B5F24F|nr:hypothetical protein [Natronomonas salina]QLD90534.1 hypothetical protein HWV07_16425 [Natronomonas salina]